MVRGKTRHFSDFRILIGNVVAALIPQKALRQKVRNALHPFNPKRCIRYIKRKYITRQMFSEKQEISCERKGKFIWQCWLQGKEHAPDLILNCLESVKQHKQPNQKIILITESNFKDYVQLPDFILRKRAAGIIGHAHFSDILRIYLLDQYGGYWIDATCLLTDTFPDKIRNAEFFMYQSYGKYSFTLIQNCFIHAKAHHPLIHAWKQTITNYWQKETRTIHYFCHHFMFIAIIESDVKLAEIYSQTPKISEKDTQTLGNYLENGTSFNQELYNKAISSSFMHKLTYKFPVSFLQNSTKTFAAYFSARPQNNKTPEYQTIKTHKHSNCLF